MSNPELNPLPEAKPDDKVRFVEQSLVQQFTPGEFVENCPQLMKGVHQAWENTTSLKTPTTPEEWEQRNRATTVSDLVRLALGNVQLDIDDQSHEATIVRMLQATSYDNFSQAKRTTEAFYNVREQLTREPNSPILSVYYSTYSDESIINAARATGQVEWVVETDDNLHSSRPRLLIETTARISTLPLGNGWEYRIPGRSYRDYQTSAPNITGSQIAWLAFENELVTDAYLPSSLFSEEDEEQRQDYLKEYVEYDGELPYFTHLMAVGEKGIEHLVTKLREETAPFFTATEYGKLEYERLMRRVNEAMQRLEQEPSVSIGPLRNVKSSVDAATHWELLEQLEERGVISEDMSEDQLKRIGSTFPLTPYQSECEAGIAFIKASIEVPVEVLARNGIERIYQDTYLQPSEDLDREALVEVATTELGEQLEFARTEV